MHEYLLLEKRWKRWRRKKFFKKLFFLFLLITPFYIYFNINSLQKSIVQTKPILRKPPTLVSHHPQNKETIKKSIEENQTKPLSLQQKNVVEHNQTVTSIAKINQPSLIILKPSFEFEKELSLQYNNHKEHIKKIVQNKITKKPSTPQKKLKIVSTKASLPTLIQKFNNFPDKYTALLIAQRYYVQKKYKKALEWSIKANELDKNDENAWILYAKASYKLGLRVQAIQALKIIIQKSGSKKAKIVLDKIYRNRSFQ